MSANTYRGWCPVLGALAIGLLAFGLSLSGAPAADEPVGGGDKAEALSTTLTTAPVDPSEGTPTAMASGPLAAFYCGDGKNEVKPNLLEYGDNVRVARIVSAVPVSGGTLGRARAGGSRVGEPCDCDDDCYEMSMRACDGGDNDGQGCEDDNDCPGGGTCADLDDANGCRIPQCVVDPDTGVPSCQLEDGFINARCDLDGLWCTIDLCKVDAQTNDIFCEAQEDGSQGPLSPCAKACVGGTRDGMWCYRASDCPNGTCQIKNNVTCDETHDYCARTDANGRCCTDSGGNGWPDECTENTEAACVASGGLWLRGQDPDDPCICPVYSSGVAPHQVCVGGTNDGMRCHDASDCPPDGTCPANALVDLGPVVPPARTCFITGNRCEFTPADCPKLCQDGSNVICEYDTDCPEGVACSHTGNECTDDPSECHGDSPTEHYFTYLGDDYALADGNYLRLSELRFRGGVENAGEVLFFEFHTGVCDGGDNPGGPCVKDADCAGTEPTPDGTCGDPVFVDTFSVQFNQPGIRDYTVQIDCHPYCNQPNDQQPDDPPFIIPPRGWVLMRSAWGTTAANGHWVSTTHPPDVGNNDVNLLLWETTLSGDPIHRDDYDDLVLTDDVLIFELVGETVGIEEPLVPDGACCGDDGTCADTLIWGCGHCVNTGMPCSWSRDCDVDDECSFINWQGPRSHDDYNIKTCYGGDRDGEICAATNDPDPDWACADGSCVLGGARCVEKRCSEGGVTTDDPCADDLECDSGACWGPCDAGGCCTTDQGCQIREKTACEFQICFGGSSAGNTCASDDDCPGGRCNDAFMGYGTDCMPNCCPQPETGADCACDYEYMECQNTTTSDFTGQTCEASEDCDGYPDEACVQHSCTGPVLFQFTNMQYLINDPEYVTFSGDSTGAVFSPDLGDDCSLDSADLGWYEGFVLNDTTPADNTDDCWIVTIDFCCNEPIKSPVWIVMREECPCGAGGSGTVSLDVDEYGDPRGGFGWGCNAEHCCDDQNYSGTYTLGPGRYTWQIYGDLTCENSLQDCDSDDDCPAGVECVDNLGPYTGHFTVAPCVPAACCFNVCATPPDYDPPYGDFCDVDDDCAPSDQCRNLCEVVNRLWCEDPDGADGTWLGQGAVSQPVPTCWFDPCDTGSCCVGPADCNDSTACDTEDECELVCDGEYIGGTTCDEDPCPVCNFRGPGYCHDEHPNQMMMPVDRFYELRGADDFEPRNGSISSICWTAGFANPWTGAPCPPPTEIDNWQVTFYPDDPDNPGLPDEDNPLPPGPQFININARAAQGGTSYLWDYQGSITPVSVVPGDCYWMELSAEGDGTGCVVYWEEGLANGHSLRDENEAWGPEDTYTFDYVFCLDCGMEPDDCGPIYGVCCFCPVPAAPVGTCYDGYLQEDCLDEGGDYWIPGTTCAEYTCPGTPPNDDCANAVVVNPAEFTWTCTVSEGTCDPELQNCPEGEECVLGKHYDVSTNLCCATDGPESTNCYYDHQGTVYDLTYDVWYTMTAEGNTDLVVSTCGLVEFDSMIAVYDADTTQCATLTQDDEFACGDEGCAGDEEGPTRIPNDEYPTLSVSAGQTVLVRVGVFAAGSADGRDLGDGRILFAEGPPPEINPPLPAPPPHDCRKNRMLSVMDSNPGNEVAVQVELLEVGPTECYLDDPAAALGETWWVSKPRCTDKDGHDVTATDPDCVGISTNGVENIWRAQLTPEPVCHGGTNNDLACPNGDTDCPGGLCGKSIWPVGAPDQTDNCVHLADCEIIAIATYALRTTADPLAPSPAFSSDLILGTITKPGTKCWADVAGQWNGTNWTAPNQSVDFDDVTAAVFLFQDHPNKPHRTWPEIDDRGPNMVLNFTDIQRIVEGFKGDPYPYDGPAECPTGVTPPIRAATGPDLGYRQASDGDRSSNRSITRLPEYPRVQTTAVGEIPLDPVIFLAPERTRLRPDGSVNVDVFATGVANVGTYEVALDVSDGDSGGLDLVDLFVEAGREDFVFGTGEALSAVDESGGRLGGVLVADAAPAAEPAYLGTFVFHASSDAGGTFYLTLRGGKGTFLRDTNANPIAFRSGPDMAVTVQSPDLIVAEEPTTITGESAKPPRNAWRQRE